MKGISLVLSGFLLLSTTAALAEVKTATDANWICTTNASSSNVQAEQDADKQMSDTKKSAAEAYAFAVMNCRDCTKITCEAQSN